MPAQLDVEMYRQNLVRSCQKKSSSFSKYGFFFNSLSWAHLTYIHALDFSFKKEKKKEKGNCTWIFFTFLYHKGFSIPIQLKLLTASSTNMSICNFEHIICLFLFLHYYSVFIEISDDFSYLNNIGGWMIKTHRFRCKMMITLDQLNSVQRLII